MSYTGVAVVLLWKNNAQSKTHSGVASIGGTTEKAINLFEIVA